MWDAEVNHWVLNAAITLFAAKFDPPEILRAEPKPAKYGCLWLSWRLSSQKWVLPYLNLEARLKAAESNQWSEPVSCTGFLDLYTFIALFHNFGFYLVKWIPKITSCIVLRRRLCFCPCLSLMPDSTSQDQRIVKGEIQISLSMTYSFSHLWSKVNALLVVFEGHQHAIPIWDAGYCMIYSQKSFSFYNLRFKMYSRVVLPLWKNIDLSDFLDLF